MSSKHKEKFLRRSSRSDSESSFDRNKDKGRNRNKDRDEHLRRGGDRRNEVHRDRRRRDDSRDRRRRRHDRDDSPRRDRYRRSPEKPSHKSRHRSRTPDRERKGRAKRSDASDRSRKHENTDGRFRFDSPPKEEDKQRTILAAAAQIGAQAGSLEEAQHLLQNISSLSMAQTAKIDRKLYVGNLPTSITQRMLIEVMNEAMISLDKLKGWELEPGQPVISSWISTDGHYGFIEFRTAKEANLGFNLQGMTFEGNELRIGRPKAYLDANETGVMPILPGASQNTASGISNPLMGGSAQNQLFPIFGPSRVLQLQNVTSFQLTNRFETSREVYTEIMIKCKEYGEVLSIKMPRPKWIEGRQQENTELDKIKAAEAMKEQGADFEYVPSRSRKKKEKQMLPIDDIRNFDLPAGFGSVFVEFSSKDEATEAKRNINMMQFDKRLIETYFWDEIMFKNNEFQMPQIKHNQERDTAYIGIENLAIDFA